MNSQNLSLVEQLMQGLKGGGTKGITQFLSEEIVYHNVPWPSVSGHQQVAETLAPFIDNREGGLESITIHHSISNKDIVMNVRDEIWVHQKVRIVLPVAGVFRIRNGKISRWTDYFDSATLKPFLESVRGH